MLRTDIDWDSYKRIEAMNASTIVAAAKSMKALKRRIDEGFGEPSRAMIKGSGMHCALLEPDEFEQRYCVVPDFHLSPDNVTSKGEIPASPKATTFYKNAVKEFAKQNAGKEFLERREYDSMQRAIKALHSHHEAGPLIESCGKNVEVTVSGEICGVPFKGRIDALSPRCILDLKTTPDAGLRAFGRSFANFYYGIKLSVYRELVRQSVGDRPVVVIAQELDGDFDTVVYDVPDCVLDSGYARLKQMLADYKHSLETGVWPGVDRGEKRVPLLVPQWAMEDSGDDLVEWSEVPEFSSQTEAVF